MIIRHSYPFHMVMHEGFIKFVKNLQPQYKMVSERTAHEDCMKIVSDLKEKVRIIVQEAPGNISYTTDLWTSVQTLGYMVITCHFINKGWKLQKLVLGFKLVPAPHTGIVISEMLLTCLNEWNIASRTLAITMDNASSNDATITNLKHNLERQNMLIANGSLLH